METLTDLVKEALVEDLKEVYGRLDEREFKDNFYFYVLSSNPKFYPISGLQHYIGTGLLALRLVEHLKISGAIKKGMSESHEYNKLVAFLAGLFHDLNKWAIKKKEDIKDVFQTTNLYNELSRAFGERALEETIKNAFDIAENLERGGVSRPLQRIADVVRVADIMTGAGEYWSLSEITSLLCEELKLSPKAMMPVVLGKQRPLALLASSFIKKRLIELGLTPLVSTPEGMLFLNPEGDLGEGIASLYIELADDILTKSMFKREESKDSFRTSKIKRLRIDTFKKFLEGEKKREALVKAYQPLPSYDIEDVVEEYERVKREAPSDLRAFIVLLAYLRSRTFKEKEGKDVIDEFAQRLQLKVMGKGLEEKLRSLYEALRSINGENLVKIGERALELIKSDMLRLKGVDKEALIDKLSEYVSLPRFSPKSIKELRLNDVEECAICGEKIEESRTLRLSLSALRKRIPKLNIAEMFLPGVVAAPERVGSIEEVSKVKVCEVCHYEASTLMEELGLFDGLWACVLTYYPSMSIDLLEVIERAISETQKVMKVPILPDYISSKMIVGIGRRGGEILERDDLEGAVKLWYVFGGNLLITKNPISASSIVKRPVQLDVNDAVVAECVNEYLSILERAERDARSLSFTSILRYWLYKTLMTYFEGLELKAKVSGASDVSFRRTAGHLTGLPTLDAYLS
jgi:hypothetical protein